MMYDEYFYQIGLDGIVITRASNRGNLQPIIRMNLRDAGNGMTLDELIDDIEESDAT